MNIVQMNKKIWYYRVRTLTSSIAEMLEVHSTNGHVSQMNMSATAVRDDVGRPNKSSNKSPKSYSNPSKSYWNLILIRR